MTTRRSPSSDFRRFPFSPLTLPLLPLNIAGNLQVNAAFAT